MISLFLNTSSNYLQIACLNDEEVLSEEYIKLDKDLSKMTLFHISNMLKELGIKPNMIDKIISVKGPGSYTGLRVGVTIAKTFAYGLNKELYSLSSLFVMASSASDMDYVIPLIDARRDYVFAGIYDKDMNQVLKDTYIKKTDLINKVLSLKGSYKYIATEEITDFDVNIYKPNIKKTISFKKELKEDVHSFVPNYLKQTEAEENLSL